MAVAVMPAMLFAPLAISGAAGALCDTTTTPNPIATSVENGAQQAGATNGAKAGCGNDNSIGTIAGNIVNLLSLVIGAVAVIMIIYGGFRYITSGGESNGVSSAKNTLIYAIIGLVIVVLAQIIVHFVINTAGSAAS